MKAFFEKHGDGHEPYHAIEIMCEVLYEIKEKVEKGDSNVRTELAELSEMIDDFLQESQGATFKPRKYHDYRHQQHHHGHMQEPHDGYNPYQTVGRIGYDYYPIYPLFDRGQGQRHPYTHEQEPPMREVEDRGVRRRR